MKDDAERSSPSASTLRSALVDYFEAPGKYQLTLRQPTLLFSSIREILQIASGRGAAEGSGGDGERVLQAANFFIRAALLYPGANHYAVLGLRSSERAADLKERYRLLMRLIHPDYAQPGSAEWPVDAAVRVNRAYEVLSSPVLRREYDEQLATVRSKRPAPPSPKQALHAVASRHLKQRELRIGKRAALIFGVVVGIPAVLLLWPRAEPDHLVQRTTPAAASQADLAPASRPERPLASIDQLPSPVQAWPAPLPDPAEPVLAVQPPTASPARAPAQVALVQPAVPATPAIIPRGNTAAAPAVTRPAPAPAAQMAAHPTTRPLQLPHAQVARAQEPLRPAPTAAVASNDPLTAPSQALASSAPAPHPIAAPVSSAAPVAVAAAAALPPGLLTTPMTVPGLPAPTLAEAQPLLTQVLQMLESGSGDQLLRLLDGDARRQPGAQALSRQYEQLVQGGRPVHLSQVEFNGEPREGGVLLVTGRIRLHAGEPTIGSHGQRLLLRAEFTQRAGKVQLTALSGAPD